MTISQILKMTPVRWALLILLAAPPLLSGAYLIFLFWLTLDDCFVFFNPESGMGGPHDHVLDDRGFSSWSQLTPQWTPDGSRIVFNSNVTNHDDYGNPIPGSHIYIVASDGASLISITESKAKYAIDHSQSALPDGSRIVYSTYNHVNDDERYFEIETSNLDGSGKQRLTHEGGFDIHPRWSSDGSRIVFKRARNRSCGGSTSHPGIYSMEQDGSDVRMIVQIPDRGDARGLAWSQDGRGLAYWLEENAPRSDTVTHDFRQTSLVVAEIDTTGPASPLSQITDRLNPFNPPRSGISSEARLLSGKERVWTGRRYPSSEFYGSPAWSPDGRRIAFMKLDGDSRPKLYIIGRDGSDMREVVDAGAGPSDVHWTSRSPSMFWSDDGAQILFYISQSGAPIETLYSVNADGSDLQVVRRYRRDVHGALAPSGSRIAVTVPGGPTVPYESDVALYVIAPDGSDIRVLARRSEDGLLEAVGPEQRPSADAASCSAGVAVPNPESNRGLVRDCEALVEITDRIAAAAGLNWDADTPIVEWEGVALQDSVQEHSSASAPLSLPRVWGLSLPNRSLVGSLSPEVAGLAELRNLDLSGNKLTSEIPLELSRLKDLKTLNLSYNSLRGSIPAELDSLSSLEQLNLSYNVLSGSIPPEIGGLASLRELKLYSNNLSGPIPSELGRLGALEALNLGSNDLSGPIPSELGRLGAHETLNLGSNDLLSGPVPSELGNLASLKTLDLGFDNLLSGCIPLALQGQISNSQSLDFCRE